MIMDQIMSCMGWELNRSLWCGSDSDRNHVFVMFFCWLRRLWNVQKQNATKCILFWVKVWYTRAKISSTKWVRIKYCIWFSRYSMLQGHVELWLWYHQMNSPGLAELLTVAGSVQVSAITKPGLHLSVSQVALVNQAGDLALDGLMQWHELLLFHNEQ